MPDRLPSLGALRVFEAAARLESFRAAAEELNVTHSAISHRIKALEDELGTPLFWRRGRSVELTDAGRLYYPVLHEAFANMGQATRLVRRAAAASDLVVQIYVTVAARWLVARLHRFRDAYPELRLYISTSYFDWDFDVEHADAGFINVQRESRSDCCYETVYEAPLFPVCAPDLPPPTDLAALGGCARLRVHPRSEDWQVWLDAAGAGDIDPGDGPIFDSYLLALEAAAEGQGVAMANPMLLGSDLRTGRLVRPFALAVPQPGRWCLAYLKSRRADARITVFRDWLVAEIEADADLHPPA